MTIKLVSDRTGSKPATAAQLGALEFTAMKEFRGLKKVDRLKKIHRRLDDLRALSVLATEVLAMDKDELVAKVSDKHDEWGPFLMQLAAASDSAKALSGLLGSAEMRIAVALAVVEGPWMEAEGED